MRVVGVLSAWLVEEVLFALAARQAVGGWMETTGWGGTGGAGGTAVVLRSGFAVCCVHVLVRNLLGVVQLDMVMQHLGLVVSDAQVGLAVVVAAWSDLSFVVALQSFVVVAQQVVLSTSHLPQLVAGILGWWMSRKKQCGQGWWHPRVPARQF